MFDNIDGSGDSYNNIKGYGAAKEIANLNTDAQTVTVSTTDTHVVGIKNFTEIRYQKHH